jgi:uncharacterized protein (TIGR02452 family)
MNKVKENLERFTTILRLFDSNDHKNNVLYQNKTFDCPINPIKTQIIFLKQFIGDYLHSGIKDDCILNFASAKHPGGGVLKGSIAQEEDICRNSLLYFYIREFNRSHYVRNFFDGGVFSDDFYIFSYNVPTIDKEFVLQNSWTNNYITSAAPDLRHFSEQDIVGYKDTLNIIWERKTKDVLALAQLHNCKKITLGPWGCGVFKNDPVVIAYHFYNALKEYGGHFDQINFLLPDEKNYDIFTNILKF